MQKCRRCGRESPDEAQLCSICGSTLSLEVNLPVEGAMAGQAEEEYPSIVRAQRETTRNERNIAALVHLSSLAGLLIPFGNLVAPLAIRLLKRGGSNFIEANVKAAINFQISASIYGVVGLIPVVVLTVITMLVAPGVFVLVGISLLAILVIVPMVVAIMAAIKAWKGEEFNYPLSIRFLK